MSDPIAWLTIGVLTVSNSFMWLKAWREERTKREAMIIQEADQRPAVTAAEAVVKLLRSEIMEKDKQRARDMARMLDLETRELTNRQVIHQHELTIIDLKADLEKIQIKLENLEAR